MSARVSCPVCCRRHAALVHSQCSVCAGLGTISLGPQVLHIATPSVAALAVVLFLEASARRQESSTPYAERPVGIEHSVARLRALGVLATTHDESDPRGRNEPPLRLATTSAPATTAGSGPARERQQARRLVSSWGEEAQRRDEEALASAPMAAADVRARSEASPGRWPPPHSTAGSSSRLAAGADVYAFDSPSVPAVATAQERDERGGARLHYALEHLRGAELHSVRSAAGGAS